MGPCEDELAEEQRLHGDLLFTDVPESYHAISSKVLSFFDYAKSVEAKFAMKTDDDTFVFVDRLLQELKVSIMLSENIRKAMPLRTCSRFLPFH